MNDRSKRSQELVERPSESLAVEIKTWIDPDQPEGQAKIIKAALALRNQNGGHLIIGFDNNTLKPDKSTAPSNVQQLFHIDKIQALITKFSSESFEIFIDFPTIDGQEYPVFTVPSGVRTPVSAKTDLHTTAAKLISINDVYVRTLNANNIVSSAKATWKDWSRIIENCFENREADIGRFLRRHLSGMAPDAVRDFVVNLSETGAPRMQERLMKYIAECSARYLQVVADRKVSLPEHAAWDAVLLINGEVPKQLADRKFLTLLESNNPQYSGWPIWYISSRMPDPAQHPYVFNGTWEEFVIASFIGNDIDFSIFDPRGKFYIRRALKEDIRTDSRAPKPFSQFEYGLHIGYVAETLAVGLSFATAMGCTRESTELSFLFRWEKLKGRHLVSWEYGRLPFVPQGPAYQDIVESSVNIPLDTSLSSIPDFVEKVVGPLFQIFDGFNVPKATIEELTRRLLERRR